MGFPAVPCLMHVFAGRPLGPFSGWRSRRHPSTPYTQAAGTLAGGCRGAMFAFVVGALVSTGVCVHPAVAEVPLAPASDPRSDGVTPADGDHNILVVIADDLGVDQLASYGEGANVPPTPTIDSLARNGVLFRNAYANPLCSPTRASMVTGRHAFRHLVGAPVPPQSGAETPGLALAEVTIAEVLQGAGFDTAFFGKWHISNTVTGHIDAPNLQGFDHFAGSLNGALLAYDNWTKVVNGKIQNATAYATTDTINDAIRWIGDRDDDDDP